MVLIPIDATELEAAAVTVSDGEKRSGEKDTTAGMNNAYQPRFVVMYGV